MSKLKIRVELNKGGNGILLGKLVAVAYEADAFLRMFSEDIGVDSPAWIARDFDNNSVDFNCECMVDDQNLELMGYTALIALAENQRDSTVSNLISAPTWRQFAQITKPIDPDELIRFGVYNGAPEPRMFEIGRDRFVEEQERRKSHAKYYGEVQGIIHSFYKESDSPKIVIRELSSKALIDCYFDKRNPAMYDEVIKLLEDSAAVIFVEGDVTEDLETGIVTSIAAKDFRPAPRFDLSEFENRIGSFPDFTGNLTTAKAIDDLRENGDN